jgi:DNA-binding beta-propeller fold protein YncE
MTDQPPSPPSGLPPPAPGQARRQWREAHPATSYTSWIRRRFSSIIDFTLLFIIVTACALTGGAIEGVSCAADPNTVLPFAGLSCSVSQFAGRPSVGVAVDNTEAVYVADTGNNQVLKLAAGASVPAVLPFIGLSGPMGVAVDGAGTVYVADTGNNRVVKLALQ